MPTAYSKLMVGASTSTNVTANFPESKQLTQIVIPFQSLLLRITKHLHFPAPKYDLIDVDTNNVLVSVFTDSGGPEAYKYMGGPCLNIPKSCENAAHKAVCDLMERFNVWVEDISISKLREIERCAGLYELKRRELRNITKGVVGTPLLEKLGRGTPIGSEPVFVDFTAVLQLILATCNIDNSGLETIAHGQSKYTAWITIVTPKRIYGSRTFFSMRCNHIEDAKNSLARHVIQYLIPIYNLEIIDANYNPKLTAYAAILCALEMESYLAAKERFLAMKVITPVSRLLPVKKCSAQNEERLQIPTMISDPLPPQKKSYKASSMELSVKHKMQSGKRKYFTVPPKLTTVFKRAKYNCRP